MLGFYPLAALVGLVAAVPAAPEAQRCKPRTICVDKINTCGVRYGGCYDVCKTADAPVAPACATEPTTTWKTVTLPTKPTVITTTAVPTICADYVNKCGQWYGGCFASTSPFPTFTAPPCSLDGPKPPPTTITTTPRPTPPTPVPTVCVDYINKCGQTYGGCFASTSPFPTFTAPSCSLDTITSPTTIRPTPTPTKITTAVPTICADYVNKCGKTYGGCFPSTRPFPTFTDPGCP